MRPAWFLFGLLVFVAAPAQAQKRVPDLSGAWTLRGDSTTLARVNPTPGAVPDTAAVRDTVAADSTGDTTAVADTAWPGVPAGAGRQVRRVPERDLRQFQLLRGMAQAVRSFTLQQSDSTLVVTNDDGFTYAVYLDGRKAILPFSDSVSVEAKGKWDDGALVIEYRPTGGGRLVETYHLADSRAYLRMDVSVEYKSFRPFWQTRMYRRAEAGS
jgi:hypothetical protein